MRETREFRKRLENVKTRSKPLQSKWRNPEEGSKRSKETREFRKRGEHMKTRSKPVKRTERI